MKFLKDGFLFSDRILNFSIVVHMCSKLLPLPSNYNSAVDISAANTSVADISIVEMLIPLQQS